MPIYTGLIQPNYIDSVNYSTLLQKYQTAVFVLIYCMLCSNRGGSVNKHTRMFKLCFYRALNK